jgi:hypothetical protein
MRDPRGKILTVFLWLSLVGSLISAVGFVYSDKKWQEAAATVVLTFTATALSAALIEVSVRIRDVWERAAMLRRFEAFFHHSGRGPERAALVLACFPTADWKSVESGNLGTAAGALQRTVLSAAWQQHSLKHLSSIHPLGTTMADVELASDIIATFAGVGLSPPTILWDVDAIAEAEKSDSLITTFISIGLSSNIFSVWLSNEKSRGAVKIDSADEVKIGSRFENTGNWTQYRESTNGTSKYGLLAKVSFAGRKTAMIVGGISAESSTRMSKYVSANWQSLLTSNDPQSHEPVAWSDFSAVVEFTIGGAELFDLRVRTPPG